MGYLKKISTVLCFLLCLLICFIYVQSAPPFNGWPDMNRRLPARMEPPGCVYKGQKYEHGEQIATPEPCLNCTCIKGLLVCYLRVCPTAVAPKPGCFPAREVGECCPTVICGINDLLPQPDKTDLEGDVESQNETVHDDDVIDLRPTFKPSSKEPDTSDIAITTESIGGTGQDSTSSIFSSVSKAGSTSPSTLEQEEEEVSYSSEHPDHETNQFIETSETSEPSLEKGKSTTRYTSLSPPTSTEIAGESTSAYKYSTGTSFSSETLEETSLRDFVDDVTLQGAPPKERVSTTSTGTTWWGSTSSRDTEDTHTTLGDSKTHEDASALSEFTDSVPQMSPGITGTTGAFPTSVMGGSSSEGDSLVFVTSSTLPTMDATDYDISFLNDIPGGCLVNGTLYGDGSAMLSGSFCEYCFCIRGKQTCLKPKCHLVVEGCFPKYDSEFTCCPTRYDCSTSNTSKTALNDELETTTSREITTTTMKTTLAEIGGFCTVRDVIYLVGEAVPSEITCSTCFCTTAGVICKKVSCSPPVEGCKPHIPEGHCCPTEYRCDDQVRLHGDAIEDSENYLQPHPTRSAFLTTTTEEKDLTSGEGFPSSLWTSSSHESKQSTPHYTPSKEEKHIFQEEQQHFVQEKEASVLFTPKSTIVPHRQQILDVLIPAERRLDGVTGIEEYLKALATTIRGNTEISKDPNPVYIPKSTTHQTVYTGRTFVTLDDSSPDITKGSNISEYNTFYKAQETSHYADSSGLHISKPVVPNEKDLKHITVTIPPKEHSFPTTSDHTSTYSYTNDSQTTSNQSLTDTTEGLITYSVSQLQVTTEHQLSPNTSVPFHLGDSISSSTDEVYESGNTFDRTSHNVTGHDQATTSDPSEIFKSSGIHSDSEDLDGDFGSTTKMSEVKSDSEVLTTFTDQHRTSTAAEGDSSKTSDRDSMLNNGLGLSDTPMTFQGDEFSSTETTILQQFPENTNSGETENIPGISLSKDEEAETTGNQTNTIPKLDVSEGNAEFGLSSEILNIRDEPTEEPKSTTGLLSLDTMSDNISEQQITAHDINMSPEDDENLDQDSGLHANVSEQHGFKDSVIEPDFDDASLPDSYFSTTLPQTDLSESFATSVKLGQNETDANLNAEKEKSEIEAVTPALPHLATDVSNEYTPGEEQVSETEDLFPSSSTFTEITLTDKNAENEDHSSKHPAVTFTQQSVDVQQSQFDSNVSVPDEENDDVQQSQFDSNVSLPDEENDDHKIETTDPKTTLQSQPEQQHIGTTLQSQSEQQHTGTILQSQSEEQHTGTALQSQSEEQHTGTTLQSQSEQQRTGTTLQSQSEQQRTETTLQSQSEQQNTGTTLQYQSEQQHTGTSDDFIQDHFETVAFESQRDVTQSSAQTNSDTELETDSNHFTLTRMPSTITTNSRDKFHLSTSATHMPTTQGNLQASVPQLYEEGYEEYDDYSADDPDESHLPAEERHNFDDALTFRIPGHAKYIPKRPWPTRFQGTTVSVDNVAEGSTVGIIHIGVPLTVEGYRGNPKKDTLFNDIYVVDGGKGRTTESGGVIYMDPKYTDIKPEIPPVFKAETRFPKTTEITTLSYRNPFYTASLPSSSISIDRADHDVLHHADKKKPRIENRKPLSSSDKEGNQNVKIIPFVAEDALTSLGQNKNQTVLAQLPSTKPTPDIVSDFCFVSGRIFINGETIVKPDPCELCRCFYGRELCQLQRCPKPPSPDCIPEHLPGFCCPRYTCNGNAKPESSSDNQPPTEIISSPGKPFAPKKPDSDIPSFEDEPERHGIAVDYSYELDATTETPVSDSKEFEESYENVQDEQNSREHEENAKHTTKHPDTVVVSKQQDRKPETFTDLPETKFKFGNRVRPAPSLTVTKNPVVRPVIVNRPRRPTLFTARTVKSTVPSTTATQTTTTTTTERTTTRAAPTTPPVVTTTKGTTTTTTTTESPKPKSTTAAEVPLFDPWGLLKVSGCNIYGKFYSVNERVEILSGPCNHCICASNGVECNDIC